MGLICRDFVCIHFVRKIILKKMYIFDVINILICAFKLKLDGGRCCTFFEFPNFSVTYPFLLLFCDFSFSIRFQIDFEVEESPSVLSIASVSPDW